MPAGQLQLVLCHGKSLKDAERFCLSRQDPYVVVECGTTKIRSKTHTDGGKNPRWNERFDIALGPDVHEVKLACWNKNVASSDDMIGSGRLSLQQVFQAGRQEASVQLVSPKGKSAGEIIVTLQFQATGVAGAYPGAAAPGGYPMAPHAMGGVAHNPVGAGGQLDVQVVRASNLKNVESVGQSQDPYVVVQMGTSRFRTHTKADGGRNPSFSDRFTFTVGPTDSEISVEVWDRNHLTSDKIIGSGRVSLASAMSHSPQGGNSIVQLTTAQGRSAGELQLAFVFRPSHGAGAHGAAPYLPQHGAAPYPPQHGAAPYPPQHGAAPYPPQHGAAPYPPQHGVGMPMQQGMGMPPQQQGFGMPPPQGTMLPQQAGGGYGAAAPAMPYPAAGGYGAPTHAAGFGAPHTGGYPGSTSGPSAVFGAAVNAVHGVLNGGSSHYPTGGASMAPGGYGLPLGRGEGTHDVPGVGAPPGYGATAPPLGQAGQYPSVHVTAPGSAPLL